MASVDIPGHIAAHPTVVVPHPGGWWSHDHAHEHPGDHPPKLQHDRGFAHGHEHRWDPADPADHRWHHHDPGDLDPAAG